MGQKAHIKQKKIKKSVENLVRIGVFVSLFDSYFGRQSMVEMLKRRRAMLAKSNEMDRSMSIGFSIGPTLTFVILSTEIMKSWNHEALMCYYSWEKERKKKASLSNQARKNSAHSLTWLLAASFSISSPKIPFLRHCAFLFRFADQTSEWAHIHACLVGWGDS